TSALRHALPGADLTALEVVQRDFKTSRKHRTEAQVGELRASEGLAERADVRAEALLELHHRGRLVDVAADEGSIVREGALADRLAANVAHPVVQEVELGARRRRVAEQHVARERGPPADLVLVPFVGETEALRARAADAAD